MCYMIKLVESEVSEYLLFNGVDLRADLKDKIVKQLANYTDEDERNSEMIIMVQTALGN